MKFCIGPVRESVNLAESGLGPVQETPYLAGLGNSQPITENTVL